MKQHAFSRIPGLILGAITALPVSAHHSVNSFFDLDTPIAIDGTLTSVRWANPHVRLTMESVGDDGEVENWQIESGGPTLLHRLGVTAELVDVGAAVARGNREAVREPVAEEALERRKCVAGPTRNRNERPCCSHGPAVWKTGDDTPASTRRPEGLAKAQVAAVVRSVVNHRAPHAATGQDAEALAAFLVASEVNRPAAKDSILGTVIAPTGEPLEGATVIAFNVNTGDAIDTLTDERGNFRLKNLAKGTYEISVAYDGYDLYTSPEIEVDGKAAVRHDVRMVEMPRAPRGK